MDQHHYEGWDVADASVDAEVERWDIRHRRSRLIRSGAAIFVLSGIAGIVTAVVFKVRYDAISSRAGDLKSLEARIDALQVEQVARREDLQRLHQSIVESQNELATAQRRTQRAQCQADNARLDAEVTVRQVTCYKAIADRAACDAKNAKDKTDGSLFGALIGAGLAVATGGGSLLAVGGAALGSAESGNHECPAVRCELDPAAIESGVLAIHGLSHRKSCADVGRT